MPPDGDWTTWVFLGGRGAGKTRAGAEWVRGMALGLPPFADRPCERIALVGETYLDVREVMVEGVSGLMAIHPDHQRPDFQVSRRRVVWPNGAVAQLFSSEDPEGLRGPQFDAAWCDEFSKWRRLDETWDMLQFGLRLGPMPRQCVTATPRPVPLLRRLLDDPNTVVTHATTRENAANLSPAFLDTVVKRYAGTRLGRQELDGELISDRSDALWRRDALDRQRWTGSLPDLRRVVVAVDPPATSSATADACGIVSAGADGAGRYFVLDDKSLSGATPAAWAERAIALFRWRKADTIVAEVNQGGDMVTAVLRQVDETVPVDTVRATRGKWLRAEPIAALYEQGRVFHARTFAALEDEMCDFGPDGLSGGRSPDRLDALVWALTALAGPGLATPRVRGLASS